MNYTSRGTKLLKQVIEDRNLKPVTDEQMDEIAPPKPPYPYTAEELERDNPYNQWFYDNN